MKMFLNDSKDRLFRFAMVIIFAQIKFDLLYKKNFVVFPLISSIQFDTKSIL